MTNYKNIQVPISAVSTSSHSEQRSQARQSRWYCGKTWESRSVPNLKEALHLTMRGFLVYSLFVVNSRRDEHYRIADIPPSGQRPARKGTVFKNKCFFLKNALILLFSENFVLKFIMCSPRQCRGYYFLLMKIRVVFFIFLP